MHFSLRSFTKETVDALCYYRLHTEQGTVYSPLFADQPTALRSMKEVVIGLRTGSFTPRRTTKDGEQGHHLTLFAKEVPVAGSPLFFSDRQLAYQTLLEWQAAAAAPTFPLSFWELAEPWPEITSLTDLLLEDDDENYAWQEYGSSLLHVDEKEQGNFRFKPKMGVQANIVPDPCQPLFNALQPFAAVDLPLFSGRKQEVEEIYTLLQQRNLLLLYGAPRVGKTSLLQCGLANRLDQEKEQLLLVRREEESLLSALRATLREALLAAEIDAPATEDPILLARALTKGTQRQLYLVFDQLEHFFSPEVFDEERAAFFDFTQEWLATAGEEAAGIRIILVLREAFLAPVAEYEARLPALLNHRYRLLPLKKNSLIDTTVNMLDILSLQQKLFVSDSGAVADKVYAKLAAQGGDVNVHCLQIYLHQLQQRSCRETTEGPVPIDPELIDRLGPAPPLIDDFIGQRLQILHAKRPPADQPQNPALEQEISELKASRESCGCGEKKVVAAAAAAAVPVPVPAPFPWGVLLALAAIPFGLFFLYQWFFAEEQALTECEMVSEVDSCTGYINYLSTYGDSSSCASDFRAILNERDCELWRDYQLLEATATCGAYQNFLAKYEGQEVKLDRVRAKLMEWECPIVRDTVQLTVRDTIVRRVNLPPDPAIYARRPNIPASPGENPPCKEIGSTTFKSVGPLWIMTDALPGGPFAWEDALDACAARGWRLPCIGEIDFLIEKIYRDDPGRAYEMLAGGGECSLINPAEAPGGVIEFWTATEANDAFAWSYFFDVTAQTIRRQPATPKSARLPCLCVEKDQNQQGSGIPPCYQKQIER